MDSSVSVLQLLSSSSSTTANVLKAEPSLRNRSRVNVSHKVVGSNGKIYEIRIRRGNVSLIAVLDVVCRY